MPIMFYFLLDTEKSRKCVIISRPYSVLEKGLEKVASLEMFGNGMGVRALIQILGRFEQGSE